MHFIALEHQPTSLRGGQELNLFEICRGLAQRGHQVSLLYEQAGNLLEQYRTFCDHTIPINGYGFDRRKLHDVLRFLPSLASLPQIPTGKDSVVFSNAYHSTFFGHLLARYRQIPLLCYLQIPPFDFNRQRLFGLQGVNRFIAVSDQTRSDWSKLGYQPDKIDLVYNGTDTNKFAPAADFSQVRQQWGISESTRVISFVGRLDKEKGIETLIKAFALVKRTEPDAKLLIAGKPLLHVSLEKQKECPEEGMKYQRSLEAMLIQLGIEDSVAFLGHLTQTASLYQVSDITVMPSLWPEPFGRVIIEAMACGTPVIASRTGGIPEVLTGEFRSHLVEPGNEFDLAKTLQSMLYWRAMDPSLGLRSRDYVLQKFSLDAMVDGIEKILFKVVNDG